MKILHRVTGGVLLELTADTLINADLNGADLGCADLRDADLRGAFIVREGFRAVFVEQ